MPQWQSLSQKLNNLLQSAMTLEDLAALLGEHRMRMDGVHVAQLCSKLTRPSTLSQLSKLHAQELLAIMQLLCEAVTHAVARMRPRQSSNVLWALGKVAQANPAWQAHPGGFSQEPSFSLWEQAEDSASVHGAAPRATRALHALSWPCTAALLQRLGATLHEASGRDIAQALYGAAVQRYCPGDLGSTGSIPRQALLAPLLAQFRQLLPSCSHQDLSMAIYAVSADS